MVLLFSEKEKVIKGEWKQIARAKIIVEIPISRILTAKMTI